MPDYLDEMIKVHDEVMYAAGDGCWSKERRREAMLAAYNVVQTAHWGNPLVKLSKPRDLKWTDCPASEPATVRYIDKLVVGDGVALTSIAHPISPEQKKQDAMWEAVKLASGGSY